MSTPEPSEDELRAAYEAEIKKIRIEQIVLEQIVSLINLGMRRTGLAPGTEDERDLGQVQIAIEAVRALLPLVDQIAPPQAGPIRDALSQLQMAFVRLDGSPEAGPGPGEGPARPGAGPAGADPGRPGPAGPTPPAGASPGPPAAEPEPLQPGEPGPAQRSGRLWIPGQ